MVDLTALAAPFAPNQIEWRVGSTTQDKKKGMALAYLTARDVMDRLDEVCGAANWQDRYEFHGSRTICYLSIRLGDEWVTKADGAGDSDVEAEKGAISDALKRCAVKWGIGRYLYDVKSPWVEIEPMGRSFKIKDSEMAKLERVLPSAQPSRMIDPPRNENKPQDGSYTTTGGFVRKPGERLSAEDAPIILDVLLKAMDMAKTVADLDAWAGKQLSQIETLPDAGYDTFKVAYKNFRADLKRAA